MNLNFVRGEGNGTPVFFQHGLCGNAAQTLEAFPQDPRFKLHTLECRGHGASDIGPIEELSIKTFANDVAERIDTPSIVGGISMGAAIALHLAVHKPDLVKALVLARPAWVVDNAPINMQPNLAVGELLSQFPPEAAKQEFVKSTLGQHLAATAPDNFASLTSFFSRQPIAATSALLTLISSDGPGVTEKHVRGIKVPTLILATEQDYIHPRAHADALHAMIPNSRLEVITPKGVDKPRYVREFQSALLKFFKENT